MGTAESVGGHQPVWWLLRQSPVGRLAVELAGQPPSSSNDGSRVACAQGIG